MKRILFFVIFLFVTKFAVGQAPQQIEADLLKAFKRINYWYGRQNADPLTASDSLDKANDIFAARLKAVADKYPSSIGWPFASLQKNYVTIKTSADGLFRIYSWDTQAGGTMHLFENVFQYKSGNRAASTIKKSGGSNDSEDWPWYKKLYTLKALNNTYYLATFLHIGSTKDMTEGVRVFSMHGGKLNVDTKIIKTKSGLHSQLSYDYDFRSIVDIPYEKRPTVTFDNQTKTIHLPLVNSKGMVTKGEIVYKFNGQYFEKVKS